MTALQHLCPPCAAPSCSTLVVQAMPARLQGLGQPLLSEAAAEAVAEGSHERAARKRVTPNFWRQFEWCLSRAVFMKTRQPLLVFTDHAIFALTGGRQLGTRHCQTLVRLCHQQERQSAA